VDEGILQLTDFESPDPNDYYFGKRQLGVDARRLWPADPPEKGAVGAMREGGDSFGGRPLAVVPTRTVALFSGLVKVGAGGQCERHARHSGLQRRAAADGGGDDRQDKLGHADRPLTVRDPVVADMVLPRFLAPGDHASAALNMNNVEGKPGNYVATLTTSGPVGLPNGAKQTVVTQALRVGQRVLLPVELDGTGIGIANITLNVKGPAGFTCHPFLADRSRARRSSTWRATRRCPLRPRQTFSANGKLVADLIRGTRRWR
jgi:uncharacterized protein YfaS (alpha-2-macroglobulin family)